MERKIEKRVLGAAAVFLLVALFLPATLALAKEKDKTPLEGTVLGPVRNIGTEVSSLPGSGESLKEGEETARVQGAIGYIVNFVLGFAASVFFILIVYAGYLWLTAQGNQEKADHARKIITQAVVGLMVVLFSYLISFAVASLVTGGTGFLQARESNPPTPKFLEQLP